MADEGIYVVVSIADNGVVHAWGEGPCHDPKGEQVMPFANRKRARQVADQFRREEAERLTQPGETGRTEFRAVRILGVEPVEVQR